MSTKNQANNSLDDHGVKGILLSNWSPKAKKLKELTSAAIIQYLSAIKLHPTIHTKDLIDKLPVDKDTKSDLYGFGLKFKFFLFKSQYFPCYLCHREFLTKILLNTHLERLHMVILTWYKYPCLFCNKYFRDQEAIRQHMYYAHNCLGRKNYIPNYERRDLRWTYRPLYLKG